MHLSLFTLAALLTAAPALAADTRPSLCTAGEEAIFSCAMGAKIVSLCGTPDLSPASGSLTYRFGRPGKIELTHPEPDVRPGDAFFRGIVGAAGGDYVRFWRGDTAYTLVYTDGPRMTSFAGLEIHRRTKAGVKEIARMTCKKDPLGDTAFGLLYKPTIPSDQYVMD